MRYTNLLVALLLASACMPSPQEEITLTSSTPRYAAATTSSAIIDTLAAGLSVYRLTQKGNWLLVCYRGVKGWIPADASISTDYVEGTPSEESLIAQAPDDSVTIAVEEGDKRTTILLSQLSPWFVPDDSLYAGFYEGLPGEEVGLVIVNIYPTAISLSVKVSYIDPEALEPREEEYIFTSEVRREGNLLKIDSDESPFRKAEFIRKEGLRGLLIQQKDRYAVLWKRRF
ncbi:MAG: hypothetical protein N3E49_08980 [Bacteroidia bacterium]|nr:hypothetical protein [Bacteroidia bacterium]